MDYDVIVMGSGPGGHACAIECARAGRKTLIVEEAELGGVCTNTGCIPTKALWSMAGKVADADALKKSRLYKTIPEIDVSRVFTHAKKAVKTARLGVEKNLREAGAEIKMGRGVLAGGNEVAVGGESFTAENIVLATGTRAKSIPGIDMDHEYVVDNSTILKLGKVPESLAVIGAGFIGIEYAMIFSALGSKVALIEALPEILSDEDGDIAKFLVEKISRSTDLLLDTKVVEIDRDSRTLKLSCENRFKSIQADLVFMAAGREKLVEGLGLDDAGVKVGDDGIIADEHMRTSNPTIYAIGDVTGGYCLAHEAHRQALVAANNILGKKTRYRAKTMPWSIFSYPPVSHCGMTEKEAEKKFNVAVGVSDYAANGKAIALGKREGFVKTVMDADTLVVLGMHAAGYNADSLIGEMAVIIENKMSAPEVLAAIHPHPTLTELISESVKDALSKVVSPDA